MRSSLMIARIVSISFLVLGLFFPDNTKPKNLENLFPLLAWTSNATFVGGVQDNYQVLSSLGQPLSIVQYESPNIFFQNGFWAVVSVFHFGIIGNSEIPLVTRLLQNAPNPFNPNTKIEFVLSEPGVALLAVYDLKGRFLKEIFIP